MRSSPAAGQERLASGNVASFVVRRDGLGGRAAGRGGLHEGRPLGKGELNGIDNAVVAGYVVGETGRVQCRQLRGRRDGLGGRVARVMENHTNSIAPPDVFISFFLSVV